MGYSLTVTHFIEGIIIITACLSHQQEITNSYGKQVLAAELVVSHSRFSSCLSSKLQEVIADIRGKFARLCAQRRDKRHFWKFAVSVEMQFRCSC